MNVTPIEWTDMSANPIRKRIERPAGEGNLSTGLVAVGHYCEKISPGCANCYASDLQKRFRMPAFQEQRSDKYGPACQGLGLDTDVLKRILRRKKASKIFWCDMSDLFGDWVPDEWIAACFGVMAGTPWHTHQILTKRVSRAADWFKWMAGLTCHGAYDSAAITRRAMMRTEDLGGPRYVDLGMGALTQWPLPNVWMGFSAEDQERYDARRRFFHDVPAAVHFASLEPLLGPINLRGTGRLHLGWVIAGGESGPRARICRYEWLDSLVEQCRESDLPLFLKQLGARYYDEGAGVVGKRLAKEFQKTSDTPLMKALLRLQHNKGGDIAEFPAKLRVRMYPGDRWP